VHFHKFASYALRLPDFGTDATDISDSWHARACVRARVKLD
jgi:hypothetical protein